jgi:uncharacterized protein YcbK (DUF882 family)
MNLKHFTITEFDSPDKPGSGLMMDEQFLMRLDDARGIAGIPFRITSGYRTEAHNALVGGVDSSAHTSGHAVDIACRDSVSRWLIVNALMLVGFNRIGIASTFIHVDDCPDKPENVMWVY